MSHPIVVPELGESVTDATILRWRKEEGEAVDVGEIILDLETEKVNLEVGSERAGVIEKIERAAGSDVKVGEVIGAIGDMPAGGPPKPAKKKEAEKSANGQDAGAAGAAAKTPSAAKSAGKPEIARSMSAPAPAASGAAAPQPLVPPPTVADIPRRPEKSDKSDALDRSERSSKPETRTLPAAPPRRSGASDRREEHMRMSRRRQTIARRLVEAQHGAAMLTTFNEIDMSAVMAARAKFKESFEKRHGLRLGIASFFVKAAIHALRVIPEINAELQGDEIVRKHYFDIGVAMDSEGGLVVPVIRDSDALSLAGIEHEIQSFAQRAKGDALTLEDLRGGCITITNGGIFGSMLSTPILNPPQVAILGLHKIEPRPVVVENQIVIRPMMYVALSYDHRIVDGRQAVQYLVAVKEAIEDPLKMWMDE